MTTERGTSPSTNRRTIGRLGLLARDRLGVKTLLHFAAGLESEKPAPAMERGCFEPPHNRAVVAFDHGRLHCTRAWMLAVIGAGK